MNVARARALAAVAVCALAIVAMPRPAKALVVCSLSTVSPLAFGLYNPATGLLDTTGKIGVLCIGLGSSSVTVDISKGAAPSFSPRTMVGLLGSTLAYNVFRDAARTHVWGDGSGGTVRYGPIDPTKDVVVELTMFGRIPGQQLVRPGLYNDTLTVTLNY